MGNKPGRSAPSRRQSGSSALRSDDASDLSGRSRSNSVSSATSSQYTNPQSTSVHGLSKSRTGEKLVAGLRPTKALAQVDHVPVSEAVRVMVEKRFDATLLVNSDGLLSGILTDKDVAYRLVARGMDPNTTIVSEVMTPDPRCVTPNTSAMVALRTMVTEHFRHLPVAADGKVVGLLDITKCLYDAISKIESAYEASSGKMGRFSSTMENLEKELRKSGSVQDESLFETMRQKLFLPTLETLVQEGITVPTVTGNRTCKFAAEVMYASQTSAVMVVEEDPQGKQEIMGIFTSKDLTQRVIAPGLDPSTEIVSRAMTPYPDCASLGTTILDALHLMHDGRYLHLPILDESGRVVALVDVLELTYGVVNQMGSLQTSTTGAGIWQNFWSSMLSDNDDGTSSHTGSMDNLSMGAGATPFAFKLTDMQGHIHRFSCSAESLEELRETVSHRLGGRDVQALKYLDEDKDEILLFTDGDLKHAVEVARGIGQRYLQLSVKASAYPCRDEKSSRTELVQRILSLGSPQGYPRNSVYMAAIVGVGVAVGLAFFYSRHRQQLRT